MRRQKECFERVMYRGPDNGKPRYEDDEVIEILDAKFDGQASYPFVEEATGPLTNYDTDGLEEPLEFNVREWDESEILPIEWRETEQQYSKELHLAWVASYVVYNLRDISQKQEYLHAAMNHFTEWGKKDRGPCDDNQDNATLIKGGIRIALSQSPRAAKEEPWIIFMMGLLDHAMKVLMHN